MTYCQSALPAHSSKGNTKRALSTFLRQLQELISCPEARGSFHIVFSSMPSPSTIWIRSITSAYKSLSPSCLSSGLWWTSFLLRHRCRCYWWNMVSLSRSSTYRYVGSCIAFLSFAELAGNEEISALVHNVLISLMIIGNFISLIIIGNWK